MHRVREGGLCMYKYMTEGKQNNLNECYIWMRKLEGSQLILFPRTASKTSSHLSSHTHEPTLFQFHRTAIMSGHCHVSQSGHILWLDTCQVVTKMIRLIFGLFLTEGLPCYNFRATSSEVDGVWNLCCLVLITYPHLVIPWGKLSDVMQFWGILL